MQTINEIKHANLVSQAIERVVETTGQYINVGIGYAEPGYDGIPVFADWNPTCGFGVPKEQQKRDPMSRLAEVLEKVGYKIEWEDEWTSCDECGKYVRIFPNSYHWTSYYRILPDCGTICLDCLKESAEEYLENIENDPSTACPPDWNPADYGYTKYNGEFETGLGGNRNDDPKKLLADLQAKGYERVLFRLAGQSQFYVVWEAWTK